MKKREIFSELLGSIHHWVDGSVCNLLLGLDPTIPVENQYGLVSRMISMRIVEAIAKGLIPHTRITY